MAIFLTEKTIFMEYYGDILKSEGVRIEADNIEEAQAKLDAMHIPNCKIVGELIHETSRVMEVRMICDN